jgi:protein-glutamine gamma-glutamyltransferase
VSTSPRAEGIALTVAVAAAIGAYAFAYLTPTGPSFTSVLIVLGLFLLTLPARAIRWTRVPVRLVRAIRLGLVLLLVATGVLAVLSRQIPVMPQPLEERVGFVLGDLLAVLALVLLHGRRDWPVASSLLPATVGLLVIASLNTRTWGFLPLAVISGISFWAWAILVGGPRRRGLGLALFLLAGAGLSAGTVLFLPWAQPHVTGWVIKAYSEGRTGLSDRSELGEIQRLATSHRRVARVWTSPPLKRPLLLRMQVLTHFDGRRWSTGAAPQRSVAPSSPELVRLGPLLAFVPGSTFKLTAVTPGASLAAASRAVEEAQIIPTLGFDEGWGLLVPANPAVLRLPGDSMKVDRLGRVFVPGGVPLVHGVAAGAPHAAGEPDATDLQVPAAAGSLQSLVDEHGPSSASNVEKLARTVAYLQARPFRYTLEVRAFRTKEPLVEFLLEKKAGYCEYFASAAAILLRLQGVPTRYVKGVSVRPESAMAGHYVVRESDAHAWIEAWIPGQGWVEADPTPPGDYAALHAAPPPGPFEENWEALQARAAAGWAWMRQAGLPRLEAVVRGFIAEAMDAVWRRPALSVAVALLLALGFAAPRLIARVRGWIKRRRLRLRAEAGRALVPPGLRALLGSTERLWERSGWPRPASRGLREHLSSIPAGALPPDSRSISEAVVDAYYRAAFGGRSPSTDDLATLSSRLGQG